MTTRRDTTTGAGSDARRARWAVVALFLINAMTFASIVPWLPTVKNDLGLSNTALGTAIASAPFGALLLGMLAGPLIARFGSANVAAWGGLLGAWALPAIALAPNWGVLAAAFFCLGLLDTWTDSAMNAHGLRVQRRYGRSIINSFHAAWSIGAVSGGLLGSVSAGAGVPLIAHASVVAAALTVLSLVARRFLLSGPEHAERGSETGALADEAGGPGSAARVRRVPRRAVLLLLALGVLLMMAGAVEDAAASWGAVYMREELAAAAFLAGMPFVACQALMTLGRLTGDRLTDRFGPVAVGRTGTLLAAAGLGGALLYPTPVTAIVGFGLCGLGVATLFPLALSAAGDVPGVRSGDGVTAVAWLARLGFLGFPPLIGVIADATRLGVALAVIPLAAVVGAVVVRALRPVEEPEPVPPR